MNAISGFGKGTEDEPFSNEYQGVRNLPFFSKSNPLLRRSSTDFDSFGGALIDLGPAIRPGPPVYYLIFI
jgi:hypothetical protein